MITHAEVQNLKSIAKIECEFKPLTLLAGLNCSGKSTLIQAIRMACYSYDNQPFLKNYGTFQNILHRKQSATGSNKQEDTINITLQFKNNNRSNVQLNSDTDFGRTANHFPEQYRIIYLSADRLGPQIFLPTSWPKHCFPLVGERGEYVAECLENFGDSLIPNALIHEASQGSTLKFVTDSWLSEIAPGFPLTAKVFSELSISSTSFNDTRPHNVGFGLSHALPVIIQTLAACCDTKGKTEGISNILALENPEAHIHPKGQTQIGRFLAIAASTGTQIIVETHSDYIIDGIRLAIKDKKLMCNDAIFHYFYLDKNHETQITSIMSSEDGKLTSWPEGFFDQNLINKTELAGL